MKEIRKIVFTAALAAIFVISMAAMVFAGTPAIPDEGLSATPITCDQWDGHSKVEVTFTLSGTTFRYDEYMFARNMNKPHKFSGTTLTYATVPGATYYLYGRNTGHHTWHKIENKSVTVKLQHVLDETTEDCTEATCETSGIDTHYTCYCGDTYYDKNKDVIEDFAIWSQEDGDGYIEPKGHEMEWTVIQSADGSVIHSLTCVREGCDFVEGDPHFTKARYPFIPTSEVIHIDGNPADCGNVGFKEYYQCDECKMYFEDKDCTIKIGYDEELAAWKAEGGRGYIAPTGDHRWDKGVVQKDGSTLYTCEVCNATKTVAGNNNSVVNTGDSANVVIWIVMGIAAVAAAGYVILKKNGNDN